MVDLRSLPANIEAERLVLGLFLLDGAQYPEVVAALEMDDFSLEAHRRIFRCARTQYESGRAVDGVTVASALRDAGELDSVGGLGYLVSLDEGLPRLPNLTEYVRLLKQCATQRRLIVLGDSIMRRAAEREDPQTILDSLADSAVNLTPAETGKGLVSARQLVDRVGISEILAPRIARGVSFPWEWLTNATCGMLQGELWVLAAHTSAGKTSAAIQTAVGVARAQSKAVALFSLEMGDVSVFQRATWQISRVDSERAKRGRLTPQERRRAADAVNTLYELPLYFDDGSYSVMEIHARLRRLRNQGPLGLIVVDYLQLLRDGGRHNTRAEAVGANVRALKLLAGEFECPVLLLSQFNRDSAKTGRGSESPRRPELYDLKESGDIECHANGVWFIHRPDPKDAEQVSVEFILPKQRDGRRNIMQEFWFFPTYQRFDGKSEGEDAL
ncbi:MAG: DnaB-like helicase C-terminal domain-containing protein [Terracidiphilus sp.]|nr:DnaB-like helicase C-terminal domain-containing protein [Terracidiphilus sp.]